MAEELLNAVKELLKELDTHVFDVIDDDMYIDGFNNAKDEIKEMVHEYLDKFVSN